MATEPVAGDSEFEIADSIKHNDMNMIGNFHLLILEFFTVPSFESEL